METVISLVLLTLFAAPAFLAYPLTFKSTVGKGGTKKKAAKVATLVTTVVCALTGCLFGVAIMVFAVNLDDPQGYGKMAFFYGGLLYVFIGPIIGAIVGLIGSAIASLFYIRR